MRRWFSLAAAAFLAFQLAGCAADSAAPGGAGVASGSASPAGPASPASSAAASPSPSAAAIAEPSSAAEEALKDAAKEVMGALRDRDLKRLAEWIDSGKGLRFSPYAHLDAQSDQVFAAGELPSFKDANTRVWGAYDGSGEPIELSFRDYFEKFVYDQDFADAPDITANQLLGKGNAAYNLTDLYPDASYVEFHYSGFDDKLEGHDWESLILAFVPSGTDWRLVSIAHNQWTI